MSKPPFYVIRMTIGGEIEFVSDIYLFFDKAYPETNDYRSALKCPSVESAKKLITCFLCHQESKEVSRGLNKIEIVECRGGNLIIKYRVKLSGLIWRR